ncbi:MAG: beta-lactamase family protein [Deltaproteobacteria bacterium]|nr:beta-lactamase family protein [Deltaproteobacteria bacterium]
MQLLALFWNKPLDFEPGSKFAYSNSGYAVLGVIIERASGMSYAAYLQQALFAPAKLERTVVGDAVGVPDRAEGYRIDGDDIVPADAIDMSLPYAAGAIRSTANDLMRWHRALTGDAVLGAKARAKLYAPALDHYAYGWVAQDVLGRSTVWHNGGIDGFGTMYWRIPDADLVVVAWTNVADIRVDPIGKAAIEAALGGKVKPNELERGTLDPEIVARLSGTYDLSTDEKKRLIALKVPQQLIDSITTIELTPGNVGIVLKPNGQSQVELEPMLDGSFFDSTHQIKVQFVVPWSGPVGAVKLEQGELAITYQRR